MTKQPNTKSRAASPTPPSSNPGASVWVSILMAIVILAGAGVWWCKPKHQDLRPLSRPAVKSAAASQSAVEALAASQPAVAAVACAEFQKLKGRWVRPDGGYVIDVKSVDESGRMDTSYANPRPIHVARAEASQDAAATKVFIELRDVNYPGSTYNLAYDPQTDRLAGIYYQAALQQRFEVFFVHME